MANDEHTYVIDPESTDPDLIRSLTPLAEDPVPATRRTLGRRRRRAGIESAALPPSPPRHAGLWLAGAFALGPFSVLMTGGLRSWPRWTAAASPTLAAGAAAWIWTRDPALLGGGDRAIAAQAVAVAVAAAMWLSVAAVGVLAAARRCPEGPLARRGRRRPVIAGLTGLAAPGLGLLLAGSPRRCVITVLIAGIGGVAGLALSRAPSWWAWHRDPSGALIDDLRLERAFLLLAGLAVIGALTWLVAALEAGRLAAGPRVMRAISGADRIPAALLLTLVAFGFCFRPLEAAHELDRLTSDLVAAGLRQAPLLTARAAAFLVPSDPVLTLRVAEREAALGHLDAAAAIRDDLRRRWRRFHESEGVFAPQVIAGSTPAGSGFWPPPAATPAPFTSPLGAVNPSPPAR